MIIDFFKYQGTGNDFIVIDNRNNTFDKTNERLVKQLCDRRFGVGADGLMLLEDHAGADFKMYYANANGKEGSMCGNGARCITAFAAKLRIIGFRAAFMAFDGIHSATIAGEEVTLSMKPVTEIGFVDGNYIIDTGSPHLVQLVNNLDSLDVFNLGRSLRNAEPYLKDGINVNFLELRDTLVYLRTYERGVEEETLACGTGVVAAAIALAKHQRRIGVVQTHIITRGGALHVRFTVTRSGIYEKIDLIGPAKLVYEGKINIAVL